MPVSVLWVVGLDKKQVSNKKNLDVRNIFLFQGHIVSITGDAAVMRVAISSLPRICSAGFSFMGRGVLGHKVSKKNLDVRNMFGWSHLESTAGDAVKPFFQPLKHVGTTVEAKAAIWIFIHRYTVAQALEVVRAEEEEDYL